MNCVLATCMELNFNYWLRNKHFRPVLQKKYFLFYLIWPLQCWRNTKYMSRHKGTTASRRQLRFLTSSHDTKLPKSCHRILWWQEAEFQPHGTKMELSFIFTMVKITVYGTLHTNNSKSRNTVYLGSTLFIYSRSVDKNKHCLSSEVLL